MAVVDTKDTVVRLRVSTDEKLRWQGHARHLKLSEFVRLAVARYCEDLEAPGVEAAKLERREMLGRSFPGSSTVAPAVNAKKRSGSPKASRSSQEPFCEHRRRKDEYCPRCDSGV